MNNVPTLTLFSAVNAVLSHFDSQLQMLLGSRFTGMYVIGSLALGDFSPDTSDIDFIGVIDGAIDDGLVQSLRELHTH